MRLLTGYAKPVAALAATRDGSRLFSAARGHSMLWEWETATGEVVAKHACPDGDPSPILACAMTAAEDIVCVRRNVGADCRSIAGPGGYMPHVDSRVGETPALAVHPARAVAAVTLSLNATRHGFQLLNLSERRLRRCLFASAPVLSLAFSPDGSRLATASGDGEVRLHESATGRRVGGYRPERRPSRLSFNGATGMLAVDCGRRVEVVECGTWHVVAECRREGEGLALSHSPDGRYLAAAGDDGVVVLYDGSTLAVAGRRHLDIGEIGCLCWSGDSARLFAGGNKVVAACELADLVGVDRGRPRSLEPLTLEGFRSTVASVVYSGDGRSLFGVDAGARACGWDLSGGAGQAKQAFSRAVYDRHGKPMRSDGVRQVAPSEDGSTFVMTSHGAATLHDGRTGAGLRDLSPRGNTRHVATSLPGVGVFLRCNVPGGARLSLLDADGKTFDAFDHPASVHFDAPAAATPGGTLVAFCADRSAVMVWDRAAGTVGRLFAADTPLVSLAVSPDGSRLATVSGSYADLRDFPAPGTPTRLRHPLACTGAAFAPDGRLVTSCHDGVVRVWDAGGREAFALELGMGRVHTIAVSPDGMTFAAGVEKGNRVVLMDVPE